MTERQNLDQVLIAAESGATVVTSNSRAARNLKRAFAERQIALTHTVWQSPEILPWSAWLKRLWQEHIFREPGQFSALLDDRQEQLVWERIITAERGSIDATALAVQCSRAWNLLHAFRIARERAQFQRKPDTAAFFRWSGSYSSLCNKNGWLDQARLLDEIRSSAASVSNGRELWFWAFDSFTPQQEAFLAVLKESGIRCLFSGPDGQPAEPVRVSLEDTHAELRAAALWSRKLLENSPNASIGVVVPNLDEVRGAAERIFLEVLHPEALTIHGVDTRRAFDISLGIPLSRTPIIGAALSLLELAAHSQPLEAASRILRSPFLGNEEELGARAMLDAHIRTKGRTELSLDTLKQFAGERAGCGGFADSLGRLQRAIAKLESRRAPSGWSREIMQLLGTAGWPGSRTATSSEFQARRTFAALLSNFAKLDLVSEPLDFGAMVRRLSTLAEETIFQPENLGAPIQLVGLLEAAGSQFDHLWILGMHAGVWPPEPNPSPFLPLDMQRSLQVTGASSGERLRYAQGVTNRLLRSSPDIVISQPKRQDDVELSISPLFAAFSEVERNDLPAATGGSYQSSLLASSDIGSTVDAQAPSVDEPLSSGGTRIFQLQAACPFRAFAELRLGAKELEIPAPGLDRRLRGGLLHRALELVWKDLQSQNELKAKSQVELEQIVRRNVDRAVNESDAALLTGWEQQVAQIERERLVSLIGDLLEVERRRPAPFRIKEVELKREVALGGITAEVKVDRIDELENGALVLLDYKSGKPAVSHWDGERPDEPQLPIYATQLGSELAAVAFVQLNSEETRFKGYAKTEGVLPVKSFEKMTEKQRPAPTFDDMLRNWETTLERLGGSFRNGHASVDPKNKKSCDRCHLDMLCRVNEQPVAPEDEAEDD